MPNFPPHLCFPQNTAFPAFAPPHDRTLAPLREHVQIIVACHYHGSPSPRPPCLKLVAAPSLLRRGHQEAQTRCESFHDDINYSDRCP